jgi:hypothetical protein
MLRRVRRIFPINLPIVNAALPDCRNDFAFGSRFPHTICIGPGPGCFSRWNHLLAAKILAPKEKAEVPKDSRLRLLRSPG